MTKQEILSTCQSEQVRFLRLQFTDIQGTNKNVEVPVSQFDKALDGEILFDGSSIEGFSRIEESDMVLTPDLDTFTILPWDDNVGRVARVICDIYNPNGTPFAGCPRGVLKRQVERAAKMGFQMQVGAEAEFFLFRRGKEGEPTTITHDGAGYFDLEPVDLGEDVRRAIVDALEKLAFEVEAAHHEVAVGQHEINFRFADALAAADHIATFRFVVRKVARDFNLHATFLPKPLFGVNGSGMHTNQSLFRSGENAFYDANAPMGLSKTALAYIGGLLKHARGMCAVTNPLVNSYKRLVPGYEAPTQITWSERNRSPLCRVPASRGMGTRVELRSPDPSCNPYLAIAVMLAAGLDGIEKNLDPGPPVNRNLYKMGEEERAELGITSLPGDLHEAIIAMDEDGLAREVLGDHIYERFYASKLSEWTEYIAQVHQWEIDRYLALY